MKKKMLVVLTTMVTFVLCACTTAPSSIPTIPSLPDGVTSSSTADGDSSAQLQPQVIKLNEDTSIEFTDYFQPQLLKPAAWRGETTIELFEDRLYYIEGSGSSYFIKSVSIDEPFTQANMIYSSDSEIVTSFVIIDSDNILMLLEKFKNDVDIINEGAEYRYVHLNVNTGIVQSFSKFVGVTFSEGAFATPENGHYVRCTDGKLLFYASPEIGSSGLYYFDTKSSDMRFMAERNPNYDIYSGGILLHSTEYYIWQSFDSSDGKPLFKFICEDDSKTTIHAQFSEQVITILIDPRNSSSAEFYLIDTDIMEQLNVVQTVQDLDVQPKWSFKPSLHFIRQYHPVDETEKILLQVYSMDGSFVNEYELNTSSWPDTPTGSFILIDEVCYYTEIGARDKSIRLACSSPVE